MESQARLESAKAVEKAMDQWQVVGEIIFTGQSRDDGVERIAAALDVSQAGADSVLDRPLAALLPERRQLHSYRIRQRTRTTTLPRDNALQL